MAANPESSRISRAGPIGGILVGAMWITLEMVFISNIGPAVAIVPVFVLPVASVPFALGLRSFLRRSSTFAAIGASFLVAAFVELLVGGILAPSLPGGFMTVGILAVALLSVALVALGIAQRKAAEFPKWSANLAFASVVGFWTLSPLMSTSPVGLVAFSTRLTLFAGWTLTTAGFLWRATRTATNLHR